MILYRIIEVLHMNNEYNQNKIYVLKPKRIGIYRKKQLGKNPPRRGQTTLICYPIDTQWWITVTKLLSNQKMIT